MNLPAGSFSDLRARVMSGVVMAAVGLAAVWAGGMVFLIVTCLLGGVMVWELLKMLEPEAAFGKAELSGVAVAAALVLFSWQLGGIGLVAAVALSVLILVLRLPRDRLVAGGYLALMLSACLGLIALRVTHGWEWLLWLVLIVIGSDVAGYFAGRMIGGPRLWPRVSPKKTWSGTVAGWGLAALIGVAFIGPLGAGAGLVIVSVLIAMAGQAGDIAESALKRHAGVKDSSNLIPGHGGFLDRFDAMIAAAALTLILSEAGVLARLTS